jgi:MFS family permease
VWFAGNAVIEDMAHSLQLEPGMLAQITSAIQFGFIAGTLLFAVFTVADRFSPSKVFFTCSLFAAACNLGLVIPGIGTTEVLLSRVLTGFFLAGIYPVGMKIASDHYEGRLGRSLGFLVGALVLGTALPHLLKSGVFLPWKFVVYGTSFLAIIGGLALLWMVPDGPYRKTGPPWTMRGFLAGFRQPEFRTVALGYFGHMWELYTFWAFLPLILVHYNTVYPGAQLPVSLLSFLIIAVGSVACIIGGQLSLNYGAARIARLMLLLSCTCCLLSPLFIESRFPFVLIAFLLFWGMVVIADSPLFSTLVARSAPPAARGASLTIVNCIGFSITIVSIQLLRYLAEWVAPKYLYLFLAIGPVLGLAALFLNRTAADTKPAV